MKKLATLFLLLFALQGSAQQTQSHHERKPDDPFTLKKLTGNIYALYGRGGNVGFYIGSRAVFVVDSQYRDLAPGIVEKIKSVTDKPIQKAKAAGKSKEDFLKEVDLPAYKDWRRYAEWLKSNAEVAYDEAS